MVSQLSKNLLHVIRVQPPLWYWYVQHGYKQH